MRLSRDLRLAKAMARNACHAGLDREKPAFLWMTGDVVGGHGEAGRGDEKRIEAWSSKGAAGGPGTGQVDHPVDSPFGVDAHHAAAPGHAAIPDVTFGVHRGTIGQAPVKPL